MNQFGSNQNRFKIFYPKPFFELFEISENMMLCNTIVSFQDCGKTYGFALH